MTLIKSSQRKVNFTPNYTLRPGKVPGRTVKGKKVNLPDTLLIPKGTISMLKFDFLHFEIPNIVKKGHLCIPKGSFKPQKGA